MITLFAMLLPLQASAQERSPVELWELRQQADAALESQRFDDAQRLYDVLTTAQPESPHVWEGLWRSSVSLGHWQEAATAGARLEALGHTLGAAVAYDVAEAHARLGNEPETLDWLRRALRNRYEDRTGLIERDAFASLRDNPAFLQIAGAVPGDLDRIRGWTFDLDFFVEEARRLHVHPERPAFSEAFGDAVARLRSQLPQLSDEQILMEFMRLAALLDDGHTVVYGPTPGSPIDAARLTLPVKLYEFSDGLFIVDASEDHRALVGARVLRLGSITPDEAFGRLAAYRGADNPMTLRWLGTEFYLRDLSALRAIGATDESALRLDVELPSGVKTSVDLAGGDFTFPRKLRPAMGVTPPLFLQRVDADYWLEPLPTLNAVYFQFNQVRDAETGPSLAEFPAELRALLRETGATALVVDVRHNNGGNNSLLQPLLHAMIEFDGSNAVHRLFVITGRGTFSGAQNFISRVERHTAAVFVGEPSASSPNFVGEETNVILPWSRVAASISNRYWQESSPTDTRQWIAPDIPVALSSKDYFSGRDPVLEVLRRVISISNGPPTP
ncbi:MAG: hypothetical protein AB7G23_10580 [Vicinamibacterales bacterium]